MAELPPIRREVFVTATPALAFRVFTDDIGNWWPVVGHSVHGAGSTVGFVDGQLLERHEGQPDQSWGTVTEWDPPAQLAFSWHPGRDAQRAAHVTVTFRALGEGTLVHLEHADWENYPDPQAAREEYRNGWPSVLDGYAQAVGTDDDATWVALQHVPGPAAQDVEHLFDDSRFLLHAQFLGRMDDHGYLVAAGPFTDAPGHGMTVLRLPGPDRFDEAARLAHEDDRSVADGFLAVDVRPWQVMVHE